MQRSKKFIATMIWSYPWIIFSAIFLVIILIGATTFHLIEWRRRFDSFYYAFSVMTTVWFGDFVPTSDISKAITVLYGFIGIPLFLVWSGLIFQKLFYEHFKVYMARIHHEIEIEKRLQIEIKKEIAEIEEKSLPRWKKLFKKN